MNAAPKNRIKELTSKLNEANQLYYQGKTTLFSDYEYDLNLKELEALEKQYPELKQADSPTQKVGKETVSDFARIAHKTPMLSIANTYSEAEVWTGSASFTGL